MKRGEYMYIQPNSTVVLMKGVRLDNTYEHTVKFTSLSAQSSYFLNLTGNKVFNNLTYQRVFKNKIRLQVKADDIYNYDYLAFKNTAYGNKWFYAFILRVDYVNDVTSEIIYELDEMQTWMFDYQYNTCYVEREHSVTDNIGDNIEPEPVALGEMIFNSYDAVVSMNTTAVVISICDVNTGHSGSAVSGNNFQGVYSGATLYVYDGNDTLGINDFLDNYKQKPDAIIDMYTIPKGLLVNSEIPPSHLLYQALPSSSRGLRTPTNSTALGNGKLGDYQPRNKKMFTYPYNYFQVDNGTGSCMSVRYEFCDSGIPVFEFCYSLTSPVNFTLRPMNYKGVHEEQGFNHPLRTEQLQLSDMPKCSWNMDTYKAWTAQNDVPMKLSVGRDALIGLSGYALGNSFLMQAGGMSLINRTTSLMSQHYSASIAADQIKGSSTTNCNIMSLTNGFYGGRVSVDSKTARRIDDFFTIFGYATNRVKTPNLDSRPHWNYVKCADVDLMGNIPVDSAKKIKSIMQNGITFWKYPTEVGNYALDNRPSA
jgi:hypothetical protein